MKTTPCLVRTAPTHSPSVPFTAWAVKLKAQREMNYLLLVLLHVWLGMKNRADTFPLHAWAQLAALAWPSLCLLWCCLTHPPSFRLLKRCGAIKSASRFTARLTRTRGIRSGVMLHSTLERDIVLQTCYFILKQSTVITAAEFVKFYLNKITTIIFICL